MSWTREVPMSTGWSEYTRGGGCCFRRTISTISAVERRSNSLVMITWLKWDSFTTKLRQCSLGAGEGVISRHGRRQKRRLEIYYTRTLSWSSCSLLAFSQTLSTFCRSTDASMYCTHSCSSRDSLKLRASLYTSMISRTSWTWPAIKMRKKKRFPIIYLK